MARADQERWRSARNAAAPITTSEEMEHEGFIRGFAEYLRAWAVWPFPTLSPHYCPLAAYMACIHERWDRQAVVSSLHFRWIGSVESIALPEWARAFVAAVDAEPGGRVSGHRAREILSAVLREGGWADGSHGSVP